MKESTSLLHLVMVCALSSVLYLCLIGSVHSFSQGTAGVVRHRCFDAEILTLFCESAGAELDLAQVNVVYGSRTSLVYDPVQERYLTQPSPSAEFSRLSETDLTSAKRQISLAHRLVLQIPLARFFRRILLPRLSAAFIPEGVTRPYFKYTRWRVTQRLINANLQVFGTQSLLMGLGIKASASSLGALSAALNWVLKDALGKIARMVWAAKMGGRFDSDAKRWRFRASLLYACGNGLEIITFLFPRFFLLWATTANCLKQVSLLSNSSTRNSLYNSFRDGTRENIGDITAKGEASIAVVDLVGIGTGVTLSRYLGTMVGSILGVYAILQSLEIFCIYKMMRSVEFRVLNFERLVQVLNVFVEGELIKDGTASFPSIDDQLSSSLSQHKARVQTPEEMANTEKIILPPSHLQRRAIAFGSLSRARLSPDELSHLLEIFSNEKFLLVVGPNVKNPRRRNVFMRRSSSDLQTMVQENCHIVLHTEATNPDIVKSSLALVLLRRKLADLDIEDPDEIRSRGCYSLLQESCLEADRLFPALLRQMANSGWTSPARFMFGRVRIRAEWPLKVRRTKRGKEKSSTLPSQSETET